MSTQIDQRIVEMKFQNGKFKNDIKDTIESLEKLKKESDFSKVQDSAKNIDLSHVTKEVDKVKVSFNALDILRAKIFDRIGDKILNGFEAGLTKIPRLIENVYNIMKSKGWSRAANLENATFQLEGLGISWEKVGDQINNAVADTAYGLDSAAKAAAQLSASGVKIGSDWKFSEVIGQDVDAMERALGAISGIAAMTNSTYDEIADVFTDAAGRGKVSADTFNRIAQRGLNSAATLAQAMGVTEASVKDMASKGKISFQMFADAMYDAYYAQAKKSNETFDGALSNMQFALGKIGAEFAKPIRAGLIEPFNEVRETINRVKAEMEGSGLFEYFTKLTKVASKLASNFIKAFREDDKNFEWVGNLSRAFQNLVEVVLNVVVPIKDAFKEVFGIDTMKSVNSLTKGFADFIEKLKPTAKTMGYIRLAFEGLFQIFKSIGRLIGQFITGITGVNVEGTSLLGTALKIVAIGLKLLGILTEFIVDATNVQGIIEGVTKALNFFLRNIGTIIAVIGGGFALAFTTAYSAVKDFVDAISKRINTSNQNPIIAVLEEIVSRLKLLPSLFKNSLSHVKEFFKVFNDGFKNFGIHIPKAILGISNFFSELDVLDKVKNKFASFIDWLSRAFIKIKDAFSTLGVVDVYAADFSNSVDTVTGANNSKWNTSGIQAFIQKLKEFVQAGGLAKAAIIGINVALIALMLKFAKFLVALTGLTKNVNGVVKTFNKVNETVGKKGLLATFSNLSKGIKGFFGNVSNGEKQTVKLDKIAEAILKLSGAMAVLVGSLMALTLFMEKHDLSGASSVLRNLGIGIVAFCAALGIINKTCNLKFLASFGTTLLLMATSILVLAKALNSIDISEGLFKRFEALAGLMGLLVGVSFLLSKAAPKLWKGALSLLAFGFVVSKFSNILNTIPNLTLSLDEFVVFGLTISMISVLLRNVFNNFAKSLANIGLAVASIAAAVGIISLSVMALGNYKGDFLKGVGSTTILLALVSGFALVVGFVNKRLKGELPKFSSSLIMISGSVALLGLIASKLGEVPDEQLSRGVNAVSQLLIVIGGLMAVSALTEKAHPIKFAASLMLITGCVSLLVGVAALAGLIPPERLKRGAEAVGGLLLLVIALEAVSALTGKSDYKAIIASIISISVIMGEILALSLIEDWGPIKKSLAFITTIIVGFGALMFAIGKTKFNKNTPKAMLAMIAIIGEIGIALWALSKQNWGSMLAAGFSIGMVLNSFTDTLTTLSKKTGLAPDKIKTFLKCSLILIPIATALWAVSNNKWGSILATGFSISMCLNTFSDVLSNLSSSKKIKIDQVKAFLAASLAFIPIGAAMWMASNNNWLQIAVATGSMTGALFAFEKILEAVCKQNFDVKKVAAFAASTAAFIPIGLSMAELAKNDWDGIAAAGIAMSVAAGVIAACLNVLSGQDWTKLAGSAASILIVSGAMWVLADAIKQMSQVPDWNAVGMSVITLAALTLALMGLGNAGEVVAIGAAALVVAAGAMDLMALAMIGGAHALNMITPSIEAFSKLPLLEISGGISALSGSLGLFGLAGIPLAIGGAGLAWASSYLPNLGEGLLLLSKVGDISHIPGPLAKIGAAGLILGASSAAMLLAGSAMKAVALGVEILSKSVGNASVIISAGIKLITSSLKTGANDVKVAADSIGINISAGMLNGITKSIPNVIKAASKLANGVFESIKTTLGIHSPSTKTTWAGQMTATGFRNGVTASSIWNNIKASVSKLINGSVLQPMSGAITKLKSSFSNLASTVKNGDWVNHIPIQAQNALKGVKDLYQGNVNLDDMIKKLGIDIPDVNDMMKEMTESTAGLADSLGEGKGGAAKAAKEADDAFTKLRDNIAGQMDIFSEFQKKTELTSDKLLENMRSQIKGVADWSYMMATLAVRGIDQGLLQKLADMGPQGYEYVNAFIQMTDDQLSEANKLYAQSLMMPEASANSIMNSFQVAGLWATQGFTNGLDMEKFRASGKEGADAVREGLEGNQGLQIHSPSRVMYQNGAFAIQGFVNGVEAYKKSALIPKMQNVGQTVINTFKIFAGKDKFYEIGAYIVQGLINGMESKRNDLKSKAESLAKIPASITEKINKIASPSKVMKKLGGFISEGLAIGIDNNQNMVKSASTNIAETAITGLKDAIKTISTMDELGIDINPTITPVLDLSDIEKGSAEIGKMSKDWDNVSVGVTSNLANNASIGFNRTAMAKANAANETQNSINLLKNAISALGDSDAGMTQNNTFNISGDDPRAIADEVSKVLQMQVERRGAVWA